MVFVPLTPDLINALNNLGGGHPPFDFGDFLDQLSGGGDIVYITEADDFPPSVGGVRTLEADTKYMISGDIDLGTDVLKLPPSGLVHLRGRSMSLDRIRTANAGSPLISSDVTPCALSLRDINLRNTGGEILDCDFGGSQVFAATFTIYSGSASVGRIQNAAQIMQFAVHFIGCADGLSIEGANGNWQNIAPIVVGASGAFTGYLVPAGTTFTSIYITLANFTLAGGQVGFNIDAGVQPVRGGFVDACIFSGGTAVAGITKDLPYWRFQSNSGLLDSRNVGDMGFNANATPTPIAIVGTYYDIEGTFVLNQAERFDMPSNGVLRYIGRDSVQVSVVASGAVDTAGGTDLVGIRVVKNGSLVPGTERDYTAPAAANTAIATNGVVTLSTNDTLVLQIANKTDLSSLTVSSIGLTVNG